jgi:hypothetical protein
LHKHSHTQGHPGSQGRQLALPCREVENQKPN